MMFEPMWVGPPRREIRLSPGSEWILHGCDFGCDCDVISDVKIYPEILHGCDPGCDFRLQIFLRCDSGCDFMTCMARERAARAEDFT